MSDPYKLWYSSPAECWEETLPLGNGHLGAMVWGSIQTERIGLNEITLWSGYEHSKDRPEALDALPKVRELVFAGEYSKAQQLLEQRMLGEFTESYLPLGNLCADFTSQGVVTDYSRELSLADACVHVRYAQNGAHFTRTAFASNPHRALILRYEAESRALNVTFRFDSQLRATVSAHSRSLEIEGRCPEHCDPNYVVTPEPIVWGERGLRFKAALTLLNTDGTVTAQDNELRVADAGFAVLAFTAVENPELTETFASLGYDGLLEAHLNDYRALYDRVSLNLGPQPEQPTDERLKRLQTNNDDPGLFALYFQYGRYLMIAASRDASLPMNLQGPWNWEMQPPWSCNYTTNINLQMNYWPALSCALPECLSPYFAFVKRLCENGTQTARIHFGCRGFTLNHNTDSWASTQPVGKIAGHTESEKDSARYSFFPLAGVWVCQELWRYYEYTDDVDFLADTAFPLLREAALFCVDWLIEHDGYQVVCPSASPENAFLTTAGEEVSVAYASTMDMTLVREAFDHFEKACAALNRCDPLLAEITEKKAKLFPYQVGRHGQLQEWCEDFPEAEPGHRHLSHLYGLFPSELFDQDETLKAACHNAIDRRMQHGGGHTGWSCAWLINLYAVLGDGDGAYRMLRTLLTRSTAPNLWDLCPPYQIDGNFGGTAGIANMLVQDRGGEVRLLPALPGAFPNGSVKGLRLKGNRAADLSWRNGRLTEQRIYPL